MSLPYTRRTPSLPSTESTLAPSQVQHQLSSSTLANSHSSPLRVSPGSSAGNRTISKSLSLGRKPTRSRKAGGFLLDTAAGGDGGEREGHREGEREHGGGYGHRGGDSARLISPELPIRSYRVPTPEVDGELVTEDTDPARIVSLALASGATRKVETSRRTVQQRSISANRWGSDAVGGSGDGKDRWLSASSTVFGQPVQRSSNGKDRAISPGRGFLVASNIDTRRSVSISGHSSGNGARRLSPLNPSSSPPPPPGPINSRQSYPSPLSTPLPSSNFPYQQLQKQRGLQEQQELRELQRQYKFTEATLQRTLKAKQQLELSDLYKRLLEIYPSTDTPQAASGKYGGIGLVTGRAYNPLMSIRNKRIRNRERIQLDLSSWEDPGAVEQWVEDVAVAVQDSIGDGNTRPPILPPPPQPSMTPTKIKRSRLDWVISPQELLAEFYWIEEADRLRREEMHRNGERAEKMRREEHAKGKGSHTSLKSLMEKEQKRGKGSFEFSRKKQGVRNQGEDDNVEEPIKKDSKWRSKYSGEFHRSLLQLGSHRDGGEDFMYSNPPSSSDESGHSSESEVDYASDYSDMEVDTSGPETDTKAKRKHHRRRRKLGQIITGGKHSKKKAKKKSSDVYILDADERRKRQEQEEMEWMAEMGGRMEPMARTYSADEEYDSAAGRNGDPRKYDPLRMTTAAGVSLPTTLGGSRSSLERYGNATGVSVVGRKSVDFAEVVVPSIAISLSPPRTRARDEGYDTDGRGRAKRKEEESGKEEKRRISPTKNLLERGQEAFVKVREGSLDRRRESLDIDGLVRKGTFKEKEKESKKNRLKGRVEKIRSEVGTKVDHFIFKRDPGSSAQPSPTGSSFAESIGSRSDDDRFRLSRENTVSASEPEDEGRKSGRAWGRSSLDVPDPRRSMKTGKYKSTFSLGMLPSIASPGAPPSPVFPKGKWSSKIGFLQDDFATSDVDTDDDRTSRPYRLAPPAQEISREPSPARSVIFQATDKKRLLQGDRLRSEVAKVLPKAPTLPLVATDEEHIIVPSRNGTPEDTEEPIFATRKELMMAKAYLTRSGIVARGINAKRAREVGAAGIVATAKEHMLASAAVSRDINLAEQVFVRKANHFADSTVLELRRIIDHIREDIEAELMPRLNGVSDGADELNEELTTTCTLAVKGINDEAAAMARRKRRQLRWIRRGGYVLLEWVVLGVMWWVWLVVVVLNIIRGVFRGIIGTVRWILWI